MERNNYKILVIDDRPDNVFYIQSRLAIENFNVITAFSGPEGIAKAKSEMPDLILLDVMMPGMDGYQACRILTDDTETKEIPIILVTAKVGSEDVLEGLNAGAFDYIKKPFDKIELIARINSALRFAELKKKAIHHEKSQIFAATVYTANHEIKQPLTIMSLALNAVKRELQKDEIDKNLIKEKLSYIEDGIKLITDILNKLNALKQSESLFDKQNNFKPVSVEDLRKELKE